MNTIQCTGITHTDGSKSIRFFSDPVEDDKTIDTVTYPKLSYEEIEEIKSITLDRLQSLLSKYF